MMLIEPVVLQVRDDRGSRQRRLGLPAVARARRRRFAVDDDPDQLFRGAMLNLCRNAEPKALESHAAGDGGCKMQIRITAKREGRESPHPARSRHRPGVPTKDQRRPSVRRASDLGAPVAAERAGLAIAADSSAPMAATSTWSEEAHIGATFAVYVIHDRPVESCRIRNELGAA